MRAPKLTYFFIIIGLIFFLVCYQKYNQDSTSQSTLPIVAIANYGPHSSLEASIIGLKEELANQGYLENQTVRYEIMDVSFDTLLIPQMIARLKQFNPDVIVSITTPVAQFTKQSVKNIPIVYSVITDPVSAGLINNPEKSQKNVTGSSDKQNLNILLTFAKSILPKAKTIGMLYAPSESNDIALVNMMKCSAHQLNLKVIAIPIDHVRDMGIRMQNFKNKVDFIYVGASGPILPSLPAIAKAADKMNIPVFSVEPVAVQTGLVLASFGVDYKEIGKNTGKLVAAILNKQNVAELRPIYPDAQNHQAYISLKRANALGIILPKNLPQFHIVE